MREWDENKLEQELEGLLNEIPENDEFEKRIEKYIHDRIRKIVFKTLAMIGVVAILILALVNPVLKASFIDPTEMDENEISIYYDVLRDYYETTRPYVEIVSLNAESKGFAHYEVNMSVSNHRERFVMGRTNISYDLNCGSIKNLDDAQLYLANYIGRFDKQRYEDDADWIIETIDNLNKLPESSKIYISLYTAAPQAIEELRKSNISLEWIEVYQPNVEYRGGLSMSLFAAQDDTDVRDELSETELIDVYRNNLKNLLEHKEMWKELGLPSSTVIYQDLTVLQNTYEDAKNLTELKTQRFTLYGEKLDVIEFLKKLDIISVQVDEVTLY